MGWIVSSQNPYAEFPTPVHQNVNLFREKAFEEVIKLKWSCEGGF